jgi:RimJ/RimL family protein N-acetyltransferase
MYLNTLRNWISIIKQKTYCNTKGFIYVKSDEFVPEIIPKLDVQIEVIKNEEDLKKYLDDVEIQKAKEKLQYLLKKGSIGYYAIYNKEIVSFCWVCDLNTYRHDLFLDMPLFQGEKNYYVFNGRTRNNYRRNGIFDYIYTHILRDVARNHGKTIGFIDEKNIPSQKSAIKLGFKKIGTLRHFQIFQFVLLSKFVSDYERNSP